MTAALVIGATGYAGAEVNALLARHPGVGEVTLMSAREGGAPRPLDARGRYEVLPLDLGLVGGHGGVVFSCLPHGIGTPIVRAALDGGATVIDLSGDLRFDDAAAFEAAYGTAHLAPELCDAARYGLTEHERDQLVGARLVANPGCYPTASLLGLLPVMNAGLVAPGARIVLDAKSGVSGAGKSPTETTLYGNVNESCKAYGVGTHRHAPEIASRFPESFEGSLTFVPHLLPMFRGMLVTGYVDPAPGVRAAEVLDALRAAYDAEPFVHVTADQPRTQDVMGTNHCHVTAAYAFGQVVVTSAIDNLVKGAAGQAVQNMNVALGLDETWGLA